MTQSVIQSSPELSRGEKITALPDISTHSPNFGDPTLPNGFQRLVGPDGGSPMPIARTEQAIPTFDAHEKKPSGVALEIIRQRVARVALRLLGVVRPAS